MRSTHIAHSAASDDAASSDFARPPPASPASACLLVTLSQTPPLNTHSVSERKQRAPSASTRRLSISTPHLLLAHLPLRNSRSPPSKLPSPSSSSFSFRMSTSHLSSTPTLADQRRRAAQRPRAHLQRLQTRQRSQVHLRQLREVSALQLQHAQLRH